MSECGAMREGMALLLTESLEPVRRELTHQHIEQCDDCSREWTALRETWMLLGDLPEVEPPARMRARFLESVEPKQVSNVVPFHRRRAFRWAAQAAAVAILVGGSFFAGRGTNVSPSTPFNNSSPLVAEQPATLQSIQPASYSLAESRVIPAASMSPQIEGRPEIRNVTFEGDRAADRLALSFDVTSRVTVTGSPRDASLKRLLAYVIENGSEAGASSAGALELVRNTYSDPAYADPQIANALAKVLRSEDHQGARLRAVDALKTLPASASAQTQQALIDALKSDPNPAVRIKALEALTKLAQNGERFEDSTLDALRAKSFDDDNLYVRVKAAEALGSIKP